MTHLPDPKESPVFRSFFPEPKLFFSSAGIWLLVGLYLGGGVQANAIVKQWPIAAHVSSLTRRLSRFLANGAVRTAVWYAPVARQLLSGTGGPPLTLIMDATKVSAGR